MSITLFRTLVAIADRGSFAGAADAVCVSNAAVGQQMRRLEDQLDVVLFDRSQKSPHLNQLGKALIPKARDLLRMYDTILDDLTGDGALIGELTLGAVPSTIRGLIPISVKRLIADYPDLHIRVVPDITGELQAQVERGAIDAAVISEPAHIGPNMNWFPFVKEELILITSPDVTDDDPLRILANLPYIRHNRRAAVGQIAENWLIKHHITVRDAMEMGSMENLSSMVVHGLGVSIVPNLCVPDPIFETLRKIPLEGSHSRILGILTRSDCSKIRLVERLLEQLAHTVAHYQPKGKAQL